MNNKPTIIINGETYPLATTLRVAFKIQSQNEHRPYSQIFRDLGEMPIESQIDMLYASFIVANPEQKSNYSVNAFRDCCLDNTTVKELMEKLSAVVQGIMGVSDEDVDKANEKN